MVIYKNYDTLKLLLNEPCGISNYCTIYPVLVKDYNEFMKYAGYLIISKKQLNLEEKDNLLDSIITASVISLNNGNLDLTNKNTIDIMNKVLDSFSRMFSMLTRKEIKYTTSKNNGFEFIGDGVVINNSNYDMIRDVVMRMLLLREPKVFEDKLYEKMYYKALNANRKEAPSIEDIILTVVQDVKISFSEVKQLNIFQLYALYFRINHVVNSNAITIYRTVSDKLPDISYSDGVIDDMFKEQDDSDLFVDLDGLAGKLK